MQRKNQIAWFHNAFILIFFDIIMFLNHGVYNIDFDQFLFHKS